MKIQGLQYPKAGNQYELEVRREGRDEPKAETLPLRWREAGVVECFLWTGRSVGDRNIQLSVSLYLEPRYTHCRETDCELAEMKSR